MRPIALAAVLALALSGCVERTMQIRSQPAGAPVYVNEEYVGETPLDYEFDHYGTSSIRVGPIREEDGDLTFEEEQQFYRADAPWYETFPIDFFFEVLYPGRLHDVHQVPPFELQPAPPLSETADPAAVEELRERARAYRERGLSPLPEDAAERQ